MAEHERLLRKAKCSHCTKTVVVVRSQVDAQKSSKQVKTKEIELEAIHLGDRTECLENFTTKSEFIFLIGKMQCQGGTA